MTAIKEYENNKWKTIGQKVGKPAKACEQYAKEHFPGKHYSEMTAMAINLVVHQQVRRSKSDKQV